MNILESTAVSAKPSPLGTKTYGVILYTPFLYKTKKVCIRAKKG